MYSHDKYHNRAIRARSTKTKESYNYTKWRDLKEGQIYTIVNVEYIETQYGEGCVISLEDGQKVWAPSALTKILKKNEKPFPRYVRPTGLKCSKKNVNQKYYSFDLV